MALKSKAEELAFRPGQSLADNGKPWAEPPAERFEFRANSRVKSPQGLKRLRKKSGFESRFTKNIPRGLKPSVYFQPLAARLKPCPFKTSAIW